MEAEIRVNGVARKVALVARPKEADSFDFRDLTTGEVRRLVIVHRGPTLLVVAVDERLYFVRALAQAPGRLRFLQNGELVTVERGLRAGTGPAVPGPGSADELVVAHFPAKVVRVFVRGGDRVRTGESLLLLEAMKMETVVEAPKDATVLETFVGDGQMVARGARLVRLEFS